VIRLRKELSRNKETKKGNTDVTLNSSIQLKGVDFSYGNKLILKNIYLEIPKNQTIALIGRSGSGKSTLINLITGILNPEKGELLIDGIPISEIDIAKWRNKIGYITQETIIFNDTIENNITLWDELKNQHEQNYVDAIEKSQLAALMQDHQKDEKIIGDRGIMLSGGQRQRIAIARELYKKPALLILDEATSALDSETERYIQKSIDDLKGKLTIIIVAHRLSTIKHADKVVVFENGEIVESGTFNELANITDSKLNNFVNLQKL
jgi:subfamily B ATP-binding cassette protein MsbA